MPGNQFENSRIFEGTVKSRARHMPAEKQEFGESNSISRDDIREGLEPPTEIRKPHKGAIHGKLHHTGWPSSR
jgi:hypothetical protein